MQRKTTCIAATMMWLIVQVPVLAQDLPAVRFLGGGEEGGGLTRLVVGGDDSTTDPATAPSNACLTWTWKQPSFKADIYPGAQEGTLEKVDQTWLLSAYGIVMAPEGCASGVPSFPELAVGPMGELWLLKSTGDTSATAWANLLHAVEAAHWQSAPRAETPFGEITIGTLGDCEIRSFPVEPTTEDGWAPINLPPSVRVRRFYWWVDKSCVAQAAPQGLRLFGNSSTYLLTIDDIAWKQVEYSELDADDWSPRVRLPVAGVDDSGRLTVELDSTGRAPSDDLCRVSGFSELCQRHEQARRRMFTVLRPQDDTNPPWPAARRQAAESQCLQLLGDDSSAACSEKTSLWNRRLVGDLVADFQGEIVVSEAPRIVEKWQADHLIWELEDPMSLASVAELRLDLLDGGSVIVDIQKPGMPSASPSGQSWLPIGLAVLATLLSITALARTFRSSGQVSTLDKKDVKFLIGEALNRHLSKSAGAKAASELESGGEFHVVLQALGKRITQIEQELQGRSRAEIPVSLAPVDAIPADAIPADPIPEIAQGTLQTLCREIKNLDDEQGASLSDALVAAGDLGYWIEILWSALQEASGSHLETVTESLRRPAAEEWTRSRATLEDFANHDAPALRWLSRRVSGGEAGPSSELVFLQSTGLLDPEPELRERFKRYLTPFDQPGRLGELVLALQYLVEAYPVEHLKPDQRSRLRQELSQAVQSIRLDEDFHRLVARVAAGVGLDYLPVPLYKSRLDQGDFSFVRQQASPISLTDRVGFEAKTGSSVIVRLERPFFVQSSNKVYYSGHAHVARD